MARFGSMKLLVLGGGFTGAAVARLARSRGIAVTATTRSESRAASLHAIGVTPLVSPRLDARALAAHADGETRVLVTMPPDPNGGAEPIAPSLALALGHAAAIAYVSSTGVYGNASGRVEEGTRVDRDAPRAAARLDAERAWQSVGASIVRAPAIYGPGRGLHLRLAKGEVRALGTGTNAISRVHVDDLAAALFALLESRSRGALYVMGDLEPAPHAEVVQWICDALGIAPPPNAPTEALDETLRHDRHADSARIRERLGLSLSYPTYREGYAHCIATDRGALDAALS